MRPSFVCAAHRTATWKSLPCHLGGIKSPSWSCFPGRSAQNGCNVKTSLECHRDSDPALLTSQEFCKHQMRYERFPGRVGNQKPWAEAPCMSPNTCKKSAVPSLHFPTGEMVWFQRDAGRGWRKLLGGCTLKMVGHCTNTKVCYYHITCQWENGLYTECVLSSVIISFDKYVCNYQTNANIGPNFQVILWNHWTWSLEQRGRFKCP